MEKLILIIGQLIVEIKTDQLREDGNRRLIGNTRIVPGGRSYRQALFAKEQGYNVILLGRLGDDYYGKTILESLAGLGIGTQFIEVSKSEYTGLSFEVHDGSDNRQAVYFDPGASSGKGDFHVPIHNYLSLCDVVLINQWFHSELAKKILHLAQAHSIPTVYVCSSLPKEKTPSPVDYLFLDPSESEKGEVMLKGMRVRKGIFHWRSGLFRAFQPSGEEIYQLNLNPEMNGDYLVTHLMKALINGVKLENTASFTRFLTSGE